MRGGVKQPLRTVLFGICSANVRSVEHSAVRRMLLLICVDAVSVWGCIAKLHGGMNLLKLRIIFWIEVRCSTSWCYHGRLRIVRTVRLSELPASRVVRVIRTRGGDLWGRRWKSGEDILGKEKRIEYFNMPSAEKVSLGGKCECVNVLTAER